MENFAKLKAYSKKLVKTKFKFSWQFRWEIEGQPKDFELYVKDVTHGPTEIENEPEKVGGKTYMWPTGAAPVSVSMTVRDHQDERISKFIDVLAGKIVNKDGTLNTPYGENGYVKKVRRFAINEDGTEEERGMWEVYIQQRGDVTESNEEPGFLEFPVTFIQFKSL